MDQEVVSRDQRIAFTKCAGKWKLRFTNHNDKFLKMEKVAVDRDLVLSYEQDDSYVKVH